VEADGLALHVRGGKFDSIGAHDKNYPLINKDGFGIINNGSLKPFNTYRTVAFWEGDYEI
jgi:hypothetical protein